MGEKLMNRKTLPAVALIASLLIFLAALAFALRSPSPQPTPGGTVIAAAPTAGLASRAPTPTVPATATQAPSEPTETPAESTPTPAPPTATRPLAATPSAVVGNSTFPSPTPVTGVAAVTPTVPAAAPTTPPSSAPPVAVPTATPTPPRASAAPPVVQPTTPPAPPTPTRPPTATRPPAAAPVTGPPPSNVGVPVRLRIPEIGVDAAVEQVSVDGDGNMATPADPWNTAWYSPGPRPGQIGNAAIDGHVDYHNIGEVVFWDLNKLSPGSEIFVDTANGLTLRFVVQSSTYFRPESAPLERIFGPASTANLNLITCGGTFNAATRSYDQRLVVFAVYAGQ